MAYPTIPITFPYDEIPPDYLTRRTTMEYGYVQTSAGVTVAPRVYEFSHEAVSAADRATWLAFWNSMKAGAGTFTFTDPNTAASVTCRFDDGVKPKISRRSPNTYDIGPIRLEEAL